MADSIVRITATSPSAAIRAMPLIFAPAVGRPRLC
jgi:hypothetical protein